MNEKLQYAEMLEIPVNTCNITYKAPSKRKVRQKKKIDADTVKKQLIEKINGKANAAEEAEKSELIPQTDTVNETVGDGTELANDEATTLSATENGSENVDKITETVSIRKAEKKPRLKFGIIAAELTIIGVLLCGIFVTNALVPNSGINTFVSSVLKKSEAVEDTRVFSDFTPNVRGGGATLSDGVITLNGEGSVYAPCDGKISAVTLGEDGKHVVEITHNDYFRTVLKGIDYAYAAVGDKVYSNIPIGYVLSEGISMCFLGSDGSVITDYTINENSVVWAV